MVWQKKNVIYNKVGNNKRNTQLVVKCDVNQKLANNTKHTEKIIENLLRLYSTRRKQRRVGINETALLSQ